MFSAQEYIMGWLVYLVAVMGLLFVFWRITRRIPWLHCKQGIRLAAATFLLMPARVDELTSHLAPTWIKGLLHIVFTGLEDLWPVVDGLFIGVLMALIMYFVLLMGILFYQKKYPQKSSSFAQ